MTFTPASPVSLVAFVLILAAVILAATLGTYFATIRTTGDRAAARRVMLRFSLGLALWLVALSVFVASGLVEARPVPYAFVFLGGSNVAALVFALSPHGRRLADGLPATALVGFQAFRLPLELVLHAWGEGGTIPVVMTWTGANFDVVSGVVALAAAPFAARRPAFAWIATLVGLALLLNVARVAVMSSPLPFAWQVEPPLQLAFHLPYALIVPVCVAGALAGHVIMLRQLLKRPSRDRAA